MGERVSRRRSYRGQPVVVEANGERHVGVLKGWGPQLLQLWLGERGNEGYREFCASSAVYER